MKIHMLHRCTFSCSVAVASKTERERLGNHGDKYARQNCFKAGVYCWKPATTSDRNSRVRCGSLCASSELTETTNEAQFMGTHKSAQRVEGIYCLIYIYIYIYAY